MVLHNFIRDHNVDGSDFKLDIGDTSAAPSQPSISEGTISGDETDVGALRDAIVTAFVV
jgi:hypothetical protein